MQNPLGANCRLLSQRKFKNQNKNSTGELMTNESGRIVFKGNARIFQND